MQRRVLAFLGAVVLAVGGHLVVADPAGAAPVHRERNGRCERGELCMWQHTYTRGGVYDTRNTTRNFQGLLFTRCAADCSLNDEVSSVRNYDVRNQVRLFEHAHFQGHRFWLQRVHSGPSNSDEAMNLTVKPYPAPNQNWNDRFSSFCFVWARQPVRICRP